MKQKRSIVWKWKYADTVKKRNLQFVDGSQWEDNIVTHELIEYFFRVLWLIDASQKKIYNSKDPEKAYQHGIGGIYWYPISYELSESA